MVWHVSYVYVRIRTHTSILMCEYYLKIQTGNQKRERKSERNSQEQYYVITTGINRTVMKLVQLGYIIYTLIFWYVGSIFSLCSHISVCMGINVHYSYHILKTLVVHNYHLFNSHHQYYMILNMLNVRFIISIMKTCFM